MARFRFAPTTESYHKYDSLNLLYVTESAIPLKRKTRIKSHLPPVDLAVNQIDSELRSKVGSASSRLKEFVQRYNSDFKFDFFKNFVIPDIESEVLHIVKGPLMLYALQMNGQAIIDLAGLLERHVFLYIEEIFKSLASIRNFPPGRSIILRMLENRRFPEIAEYLHVLGIWNKNEMNTAVKLYTTRNSIAHKNVKKIEGILLHGKKGPGKGNIEEIISMLEIDLAMSGHDVVPDIFDSIRLLCKLFRESLTHNERYRMADALLQGKIKDESEFFL
jgi:hypothetical protein